MALTRKFLTALGIEDEKQQAIIDAHMETVDPLKKQVEQYKADAEKLPEVQKQLDEAKETAKNSGDYGKLKKEFEDYKADIEKKEAKESKKKALGKLAKEKAKLSEDGVEKALKFTDFEKIELDEKGEIKDPDAVVKGLQTEWATFVETTEKKGAGTPTPPTGESGNGGSGMSRAAQLYQQHHTALYGQTESKGDNSK